MGKPRERNSTLTFCRSKRSPAPALKMKISQTRGSNLTRPFVGRERSDPLLKLVDDGDQELRGLEAKRGTKTERKPNRSQTLFKVKLKTEVNES